jgi:predicted nucleic acid-binding protein
MLSSPVALDTNGWFALLNRHDRLHEKSVATYIELLRSRRPILLTDWIIAETGNGLARTPARRNFRKAVNLLLADQRTKLIVLDEARIQQALERYDERPDKTWGLIACSTMLVMEEFGSVEILSSDQHFEQAGFRALLRDDNSVVMGQ